MAENTHISWTGNTFNTHIGCTKISDGCLNCYAEKRDKQYGGNHWIEQPRPMAESNWKKLNTWNNKAIKQDKCTIVFLNSMSDFCDKNAPQGVQQRFFEIAKQTPQNFYLVLTKRAANFKKVLPQDWNGGYDNVGLGVSVDNIKQGISRINILRKIPAKFKFLSIEPLLEDLGELDLSGIDWVIVGGENTAKAKTRWMDKKWVLNIKKQCKQQGVTFFFKQWHDPHDYLLNGRIVHKFPKYLTHIYPKSIGLAPQKYE